MENLYENGYIFQQATSSIYRGLDGDNWYLNYCSDNSYFEEFYDKNIDNGLANPDVVACCTDVEYMRRCVEESKKLGISFRVLLCSTNRPEPVLRQSRLGQAGSVLGFDVAYSGGSYYSSYEEAESFLRQREKLEKATTEYIFEKGDYVIYRLTEVAV